MTAASPDVTEARTLRSHPRRGKRQVAALACLSLAGLLAACSPPATPPQVAQATLAARALRPARWQSLRLLPAAAIPPPPSGPAPAFERAPAPVEGFSIGPTNAGSITSSVPLPSAHEALKIRPISLTRNAYFGSSGLVAMLVKAAERVAREHPGSVLWAGDLSLPTGGSLAPHASHTSGRDVDLSFYVSRPSATGTLEPSDSAAMRYVDGAGRVSGTDLVFDAARNWALVRAFLEDPGATPQWIFCATQVRAILLNEARKQGDARLVARAEAVLVQPRDSSPHADHFHVRIYCGLAERLQGCLDAAPFHPWAPRYEAELGQWLDGLLPFLADPRMPETKEAIERIVRMNATPAIPHLEHLLASNPRDPAIAPLAQDALDFLKGRRTPAAWKQWRAEDSAP